MTPTNRKIAEAFRDGLVYRFGKVKVIGSTIQIDNTYRMSSSPGFPKKDKYAINIWIVGDDYEASKINAVFELMEIPLKVGKSLMPGYFNIRRKDSAWNWNFKLAMFHKVKDILAMSGFQVKRTLPEKPLFKLVLPLP